MSGQEHVDEAFDTTMRVAWQFDYEIDSEKLRELRERVDDIPLLVWAFVREFAAAQGK